MAGIVLPPRNGQSPVGAPPAPFNPPAVSGRNTSGGKGFNGGATPAWAQVTAPAPGTEYNHPTNVRALQQFLNNHGFQVAQDGVMGPQTKSAAAAFRANHKGGSAWNAAHGIGTHPSVNGGNNHPPEIPGTGGTGGKGRGTSGVPDLVNGGGPGGPGGLTGNPAIDQLLTTLLAQGGNTGSMYDPQGFGNAAAAPDVAAAAALARQAAQNPRQEAQNQSDISSWYGLDPKASSYKLSVLGRLGQAKTMDANAASDASSNVGDIASALAGSIGGSANAGAGTVAAAGANDAGTMAALGQSNTDYANAMNPLLAAEARGQMSKEKASNQQTLLDLQDKLAAANGQATADRAQGVMQAVDKNNALGQQGFANKGNLLSMLMSMQAANPNANTPANQLASAKVAQALAAAGLSKAKATAIANGMGPNGTGSTKSPTKVDLGGVFQHVAGMLNIPNGSVNLPANTSLGGVAHMVGSALQAAGIAKTDPRYQRLAQTILNSFKDANGNPLQIPGGWFGPNTQ